MDKSWDPARESPGFSMNDWKRSKLGLVVPGSYKPKPRPVAVDLFCGAGGFSLGLVQAGFHVIAGMDNWDAAAITYMVNLGDYPINIVFDTQTSRDEFEAALQKHLGDQLEPGDDVIHPQVSGSGWRSGKPDTPGVQHFFYGDARNFTGQEMLAIMGLQQGDIDLVAGGPPCQGFSMAGKRQVADPRNNLVFEFARLVLELQPKTMVMENVPGILSMVTPDGFPVVDKFCRILEDGGFGTMKALKKSLLASAGAGAALKGRSPKEQEEKAGEQLQLL